MKAGWYCIPLAAILACGALALGVRFTANTQSSGNLQSCELSLTGSFDATNSLQGDGPSSAEQLAQQSSLIIRAHFEGERIVTGTGLYSMVTVEEVYKGEKALKGQTLCIVEELKVFPGFINLMERMNLPMQENNDYLLFLNPVEFDKRRNLTELQKREYCPVTRSSLSVFRITAQKQTKLFVEDDKVTLEQMRGLDLPATKQSDLDKYYSFRDKLFEMYQIEP